MRRRRHAGLGILNTPRSVLDYARLTPLADLGNFNAGLLLASGRSGLPSLAPSVTCALFGSTAARRILSSSGHVLGRVIFMHAVNLVAPTSLNGTIKAASDCNSIPNGV
jgi:hypothetical protein